MHKSFLTAEQQAADDEIPPLPEPDAPTLVIAVRGIPGSGKTTWARAVQDAHPPGTVARINNDELSAMLFGSSNTGFTPGISKLLGALRAKTLDALLKTPSVRLIIIDNTNLNARSLRDLETITLTHGAEINVDDRFLGVSLDTCLQRNAQRPHPVPEDVIRRMSKQGSALSTWRRAAALAPYHNDPNLPHSIIVDIDGTLAKMHPQRTPYEWDKVGLDTPNTAVVDAVQSIQAQGVRVIVMSGRDGSCRAETQAWLDKHVSPGLTLHMREAGDTRPDHIVKHELFSTHVANRYHVKCVFDDRDQVVHLWRRRLQLPTFQVADGDF